MRLASTSSVTSPPPFPFRVADKLVFSKVKAALGLDKCRHFFSAAAPASPDLLNFFLSLDLNIVEIYGMSECSGPQLSNTFERRKLGSVGDSLVGFNTKIGDIEDDGKGKTSEGEICMRGRNVMMGYLNRPADTRKTFDDDGWLKSGDIGRLDEDGFIFVTGRIKELLVTAGGENVAPVPIEAAIKHHLPCVSNAIVIGDRKKFLSCLITLKSEVDQETLLPQSQLAPLAIEWCQSRVGSKAMTVAEAKADPAVKAAIDEAFTEVNAEAPSNAQRVQKWTILSRDLSIPGGELGPTLKVKRHAVEEKHADVINAFYDST